MRRPLLLYSDELKSPPTIGKTYLVPTCNFVKGNEDIPIPVFGKLHNDRDIGVTHIDDHIHIDRRFISDEQLISLGVWSEKVIKDRDSVIVVLNSEGKIPTITYMPLSCLTLDFPMSFYFEGGTGNLLYKEACKLEEKNFKLDMNCKVCPHKKTPLDGINPRRGVIQCPAHGLRFNALTGEIEP